MLGMIAAALTIAVAVGVMLWNVWQAFDPTRRLTQANLARIGTTELIEDANDAVATREPLEELAYKLTPDLVVRVLDRQLTLAGRPLAWPIAKLLQLKLLWAAIALVGTTIVSLTGPPPLVVLLFVVVTVVGYFLPELLAHNAAQKRSERIGLELADTLDQMTIAVEAGLGFDGAMARAGQNGRGPLAEELVRTQQDIAMGSSRKDAFRALTERTDVTDLRRFVRAVIQADTYGISVAGILHTQADEMRLKRRQRAEEQAQKVPVKVLAPLMLCILPVLFIVVMGPAVLNMMEVLGGM
ncbi:type II secretion system F family protein [Enteractinococcus coprophilus]|uniref:Tight adherence protein C n=1 Tax=Enteractinococcus coprophilus TaxID=1027633 RepID=A0A543AGF0_9MICC|nr:type II secretion system F family protein [Enteractinococcus coprophilus]TQL71655.1 tight adherence protein C [Enteractinococcus coprophilus]